jgi:lipoprotein-releasing system permease protein
VVNLQKNKKNNKMSNFSLFLAWRYLTCSSYENSISRMIIISFSGIFIGTFALTLVTAIMHGFDIATQKAIQGVQPQIIIKSFGNVLNAHELQSYIHHTFPQVHATTPTTTRHGIIPIEYIDETMPHVVIIKGIDPFTENDVTNFKSKIILPQINNLFTIVHDNTVIVGKQLAEDLQLNIGDQTDLFFARDNQSSSNKLTLDQTNVTIGGIFKTGIDDFDSNVIICELDFLFDMFPDAGVEQINVRLDNNANEQQTIDIMQQKLGLNVHSWKDLYPALVAALKLEKFVAFIVLALITLVASMNIVALLFMKIINKRTDIALLRSIGMPLKNIRHIFFIIGLSITTLSTIAGISFALLCSALLKKYPIISLPDAYYVSYVPIEMTWWIPLCVLLLASCMSIIAILIPLQSIKRQSIAQVLRFEG